MHHIMHPLSHLVPLQEDQANRKLSKKALAIKLRSGAKSAHAA